MKQRNGHEQVLKLVQFALLLAIELIVCFTPLGSLPIGPLVATLSHLPVIIAAVLLGPGVGAVMGFSFGLFSFLVWTLQMPGNPSAFLFTPFHALPDVPHSVWSVVICFVPRIFIGVFAGLIARGLARRINAPSAMSAAALIGTLTNTVFVLGIAYLAFHSLLDPVGQGFFAFSVAAAGWNAVLEVGVALIVTAPVCLAVRRALGKRGAKQNDL
ncbi:MAG: ECF transporter S component [Oscillospiraceae bacterium]|jgi:uncharacterized membrane protein|nr:ECF transporter S component [Oscillospiraceae bacterium]